MRKIQIFIYNNKKLTSRHLNCYGLKFCCMQCRPGLQLLLLFVRSVVLGVHVFVWVKLAVNLEQSNRISKLHSSFKVLSELQLSLVQADLVVGEICGVNENRTVNPAVDHCCKANFAFRRPCFEALGADKTYVPPSTSQGLFTFHTDLCQAHNEELQRKKDRYWHSLPPIFLINLKTHCVLMRFVVMDTWFWCHSPVSSIKLSCVSN